MKVFVSWSGGKESCLACHKAIMQGYKVTYLLNLLDEEGKRSRSHGIRSNLLVLQSQAIGIPIVQRKTTWEKYEDVFKDAVEGLKEEEVKGGVFGDVDIEEHRDWIERVCRELEIKPILPLWGGDEKEIMIEFINQEFEAIVVATKQGKEWLGKKVNKQFIDELHKLNISPCGESGEYHTFVTNGPIFKTKIKIIGGKEKEYLRDNYWFLDIDGALENALTGKKSFL
jgi:uncharacterized protein (TIGR00290 family)